jgi:hypothetical protein
MPPLGSISIFQLVSKSGLGGKIKTSSIEDLA